MGGIVAALHALLRASALADAGMAVRVDKEDEGAGGGSALATLRKMRAWVVVVLQQRRGRRGCIGHGRDGGGNIPRCQRWRE